METFEFNYTNIYKALRTFHGMMLQLTPREKKVLEIRFGIEFKAPKTLEGTGREFGVTRERIRQIETKAIEKLKEIGEIKEILEQRSTAKNKKK